MANNPPHHSELRVLSIVEALTVTGPVKPLLMFAPLARAGVSGHSRVFHTMMTTRRTGTSGDQDPLHVAAVAAGLEFVPIQERTAFDPGVLAGMAHAIRKVRPHIIETHDCKSHFLLLLLRSRYPEFGDAGWIAFHHGYTRTSWKILLYQQLDRLTLPRADRVVTLCEPFATMLVERGVSKSRLSIISNAITAPPPPPREAVVAARAALNIGADELVILSVGRLSSEKGQDDLLEAFAQVRAAHPRQLLRLVLVGDGPDKNNLLTRAASHGDRVIFTGHLSDPWPLFHAADIFALPSHSEGSPLVILEAMAAAMPIVSTAVGGIPETLTDGATALLVPPRQPPALTAALNRMVEDKALRQRLGAAGLAALAEFSPSSYADKLLRIYEAVLDAKLSVNGRASSAQ
jgi:glycosyltransferase involved in cell wall biosynthesis